ncbi:Oligoxyloglucan reducing end-specific cellobiohydrolase, partial [Rhizophagus irregularis]
IYFKESDSVLNLDLSGNVWISNNAGIDWDLISGVPKNTAAALIKHTFSEDRAYILTIGKTHYKTSDKGKSWQEFTTPIPPAKNVKVLSFHAHREDYLLFRGTKCTSWIECTDVTYYTTDGFGSSPKLLLENTDNCIWAHNSKKFDEAPEQSIFCIRYDVYGSGSMRKLSDYRLVESEDFFKDEESIKIIDFNSGGDVRGVIGLGESQEYLAAAVKDINSFEMKLYVSVDGQKWARAFFPLKKGPKENAYTILESPSNHLIVDLLSSESHNTGTLYLSNSNGTYFVDRLEHTNRNDKGVVDFKISQSVGGILLANIVSNYEEVDKGSAIAKKLQSKISFDDGVTWKFIKPPNKNFGGSNFPCMDRGSWEQEECSLHLHSVTSGRNNGHVFSSNEAPGVLMGVGNVGPYLLPYDQCDTFLSYDGGLTWKVVRLGAHMYGIGHYGTILVIVDNEQPTDDILYSYDRGETWNRKSLGVRIVAKLLTTDPTSKNFLLLGSAVPNHDTPGDGSSNYRHFIFKLDFSKLFDRDCNRDDFDDWVAKRSESGSDCFMGKKTTYHRRKVEARCFVVSSQQPSPDIENCACTEKDFECDFNYILDEDKEKCIPLLPERIPEGECKDKDTYEGSSGYRKIPENECDPEKPNSVRLDEPKTKKCSEGHSGPPLYGEVLHRTANFDVLNYLYFPESTNLMIQTIDGKVKRSTDEGSTWEDVLSEAGSIAYMFLHDHDKTKAYFFPEKADDKTYYMWFTTDSGNTFDKTELKNEPNKLNLKMLDFHPKEYDWLLYMAGTTCPGCHSITYFSSDNGKSWKEIETWADKCIFGKDTEFSETENDAVFCSSYKDKNSKISQDILGGRTSEANPLQLVKMRTDGGSKKVLFNDVVNYFVFNEFMAVATEERGELLLHISEDGSKFSNATFPPDINVNQQAYTILPSTTGSIFLDVYKSLRLGSEYGSLFKSNSDGTDFNRILDNTNRNVFGNVDFEKVQGLDGIILANQVVNIDELNDYVKKRIITKISYDDGSHWKRLRFNGGDSSCQDCHLNLHGRTDIRGPGSIFSAPSAVGLLIGVGNFGPHLLPYNECNTFMSRDGGRIWKEIRRGPSLYEFGDQGTIIVVVDNEAPTDHVRYSWDYGENWEKYTFTTSTPVRVSLLTTNSKSTSMKFLLLGYTVQTSTHEASPVVVTLDFSQLEKRKCDKDDYELWNPMDENSDDHTCLLGEEIKFWRRKANAECHIGESIPKPPERKTCKCTKHDFECAHGYWRNETGQCELMGPDPDRPANCKDKYLGHSGYVKMKKSKCEGGENFDKKIEKPCDSGNIVISKTVLFDQRIAEYFYFNESNTILARSMDNIVWRSTDEGYTWTSVSKEKIYGLIQNPHFNKYAYLITLGDRHLYTSDSGATFNEFKVPTKPNLLQIPILSFHLDKPEYLIYIGSIDCEDEWSQTCHTQASYTWNNGKDWKSLDTYVRVCQWARNKKFKVHQDLIICESYLNKEGSQKTFFNNPLKLVSSDNFFKNKNTAPIENIVGFTIYEEFMIVAEVPTYSITLHVTTSATYKYGNILKSNGNGTFYSFSLGYANRDDKGFVDFEKMQGIQGIALANIVGNVDEVNMGNNKKLKSKITTNDGEYRSFLLSTWKLLNRPEFDSDNNKYKCDGPLDKCSLHLHSYTERRNPRDSFSSSSATGLMMGVGNVGEYLTPYLEGDTFLTRDAGATWIEVKKGAYMYEFGNQGGIIVLVDDEQATDHILYSLNEGLSWQEYKFIKVGEQPIRVFDIDTMPGGLSSKFILRGLNPSRGGEEVVVHLDFSHIFTRTCNLEKDFEKWTPKHQDNECLFGHKISYLRKIRENECYIEDKLRYKKERGENCDCTDHDFECDYNYMRNETEECVLVPGAQPLLRSVSEQCADGDGFWYELSGYRKLKASTCENAPPKFGKRHPCPGNHSVLFWIIIILSPFVIVGIATICFINKRYGRTGGLVVIT